MKNRFNKQPAEKILSQKQINRRNFIAFTGFIGLNALAYGGWRWLYKSPEETSGVTAGARKPLRRALNQNELLLRKTFSNDHLVKTYPVSMADPNVRVNSEIGMEDPGFDAKTWSLTIHKKDGSKLQVSLHDILALPKTEIVYDFKCVEGWDQISHWGGVKFSDFISHYNLQEEAALQYVGMATPDKAYYVGLDMPSAMHPQTLLAYEVNGKPLPMRHGQPLRLIIPVKYGIKNLKRIGTISFSDERPPDYWAEQGYDYYSGL
ncbi:molybdopterin-dependent oxidoreductase [Ferruginibacter paludis]|uniref:molybdopterin-dependent oxidoreductase n=1 Tax=Ferruginibacter paludis TaxID=1310417 RepID=UPI0025B514CB|nr:molybdopterin-dependent oxidoreductase [Ferruginibacter paludis]MDN3656700.1 molybdopterin-dependent oxidoreductase [Ferruginibacter paludis]